MGSDYREVIFRFAKDAPEDDFNRVVSRFKVLCEALEDFGSALQILNPYLAVPIEKTTVEGDGICPTCACPCKQAAPGRLTCSRYHEFFEDKCPRCENFDGICLSSDPCVDGEFFCPREGDDGLSV